jgi:hypothetical protein
MKRFYTLRRACIHTWRANYSQRDQFKLMCLFGHSVGMVAWWRKRPVPTEQGVRPDHRGDRAGVYRH